MYVHVHCTLQLQLHVCYYAVWLLVWPDCFVYPSVLPYVQSDCIASVYVHVCVHWAVIVNVCVYSVLYMYTVTCTWCILVFP